MTPSPDYLRAESDWLREPELEDLEHREQKEAEKGDWLRDREELG